MKHYTGTEVMSMEVPDGCERRTLGDGYIITELKDGSYFKGTLTQWRDFKKQNLELLYSHDLMHEVV